MGALLASVGLGLGAAWLAHGVAERDVAWASQARLEVLVQDVAERFAGAFLPAVEVLQFGRGLFRSSEEVTPAEFEEFMRPTLERHPSLLAVGWADLGGDGGLGDPVPLRYFVPAAANVHADRREVLACVAGREALARAVRTRGLVVSDPIDVLLGREVVPAALALLAVDSGSGAEAPVSGCVAILVRYADLLVAAARAAHVDGDSAVVGELVDEDVLGAEVSLWPGRTLATPTSDPFAARRIRLGDQVWRLQYRARPGFLTAGERRGPWTWALAAFFGTQLLGIGLGGWARSVRARTLRHEADLLERVLRGLDEGIVVADATGRLRAANPAAVRILGTDLASDEAHGTAWRPAGVFCGRDARGPLPPERQPVARALRGETVDGEELHLRWPGTSDGLWVSVSARPLRVSETDEAGALLVVRDLTERRRNEADLRRLSSAVEQTADAVLIADRYGSALYVNPAFEVLTGVGRDEALAAGPHELQRSLHESDTYDEIRRHVLAGRPFRGTVRHRRRGGVVYDAEETVTPVRDAAGRITYIVTVARDCSSRRLYEKRELERGLAADLQRRLYPAAPPVVPGLDLAVRAVPAEGEVMCGDCYDFMTAPDGSLVLALGDVTGHGLEAGIIMTRASALLRSFVEQEGSTPARVLREANRHLCRDLPGDKFVTLILVQLDVAARRCTYASAGHVAGLLVDRAGRLKARLPASGPPLGIVPGVEFLADRSPTVAPGDLLVLVTDGVTECRDGDDAELDEAGVLAVVGERPDATAAEVVEALHARVRLRSGSAAPRDDVTVLACRWLDA